MHHGLLLNEKGKMNVLEKIGSGVMNLQKDEDTSLVGRLKKLFSLENMGQEENNIDVNNNKFSVALRRG